MTPEEIIKDWYESINKTIPIVRHPVTKYCDNGLCVRDFEFVPQPKLDGSYCRKIEHRHYKTQYYRDKGCAAYKLLRFLIKFLSDADEVYWRFEPQVNQWHDFLDNYPKFCGVVRFSAFANGQDIHNSRMFVKNR